MNDAAELRNGLREKVKLSGKKNLGKVEFRKKKIKGRFLDIGRDGRRKKKKGVDSK